MRELRYYIMMVTFSVSGFTFGYGFSWEYYIIPYMLGLAVLISLVIEEGE